MAKNTKIKTPSSNKEKIEVFPNLYEFTYGYQSLYVLADNITDVTDKLREFIAEDEIKANIKSIKLISNFVYVTDLAHDNMTEEEV